MFDSSKDILYVVLSFCIIWITVFLCWMFYYLMRLLKNANEITEEFRMRFQALLEVVHYVREKVDQISNLLTLATDGATGLVKKFVTKKAEEWTDSAIKKTGYNATGFDRAAKEAVDHAVAAAAKKMSGTAKKIKK